MSDPFVGEIRILPYGFAPRNWAYCNGQLLAISQNSALFSLYGTTYGGDGRTTFGLPNMQGRVPLQAGQGAGLTNYTLGERTGTDTVTLTLPELPAHNHAVRVAPTNADLATPQGNYLGVANVLRRGQPVAVAAYAGLSGPVDMSAAAISNNGGGQAHENRQPFLAINFCCSLFGTYPSRN